jgi:type I restriction enzyme S subunit
MAGEWALVPLGEIVQNFDARRIPLSSRERRKRQGPYPYYGATGVMDNIDDFLFDGLYILIAEDGSVERPNGSPFVQLVSGKFWANNHTHVLKGPSDKETKFIYYALSTVAVRPYISGSVQAKLSQANLNRILIPFPRDERERRAIAHILGTLDDKIELNRKTAATLEAMARALFRAWFVDFEPVRAKMEGRWRAGESLPGLPAHLYDLFPARLVDSDLGEIPEGWRWGTLGEIADNTRRSARPEDIVEGTAYIALEHMPRRSLALAEWTSANAVESNKFCFNRGDILFGKLRPYFHKVGIAPIHGVCSTDIAVVVPRQQIWWAFASLLLSSAEFVAFADQASTGTKMPRTSWRDMARYPVAIPPSEVAAPFDQAVRPLLDNIVASVHASRTLAAIRDALLPKLVSGELRVKDAEAFLEKAGA